MSADAISEEVFIREYTRELHNKNAAVFVGAGLSVGSGYVDWSTLLNEVIQVGPGSQDQHDLVTLAQSTERSGWQQVEADAGDLRSFRTDESTHRQPPAFGPSARPHVLDHQLRQAAREIPRRGEKGSGAGVTFKASHETRPDRDVVVYKMHGDIDYPADAVISKDDY